MLGKYSQTLVWQLCDSQIHDLINFKTTWPDLPTLLESVWILDWNTVKLLTGMLKSLHSLGSCAENFPLIQISSILSVIFTRLWLKCQRVFLMGQLHLSKECWELWLSHDQPHPDYNGQWQRALCILAVLQISQPNPQRNETKGNYMLSNKLRSVQNTGTCYPGLGWICQVHLGFHLSASAQVPGKPALAWVACPGILHSS